MGIYKRDYRRNKDDKAVKKRSANVGEKKQSPMAHGSKGASGYLKSKKRTLKEIDAMTGEGAKNELDQVQQVMDREDEDSKGITDHIRNIFKN